MKPTFIELGAWTFDVTELAGWEVITAYDPYAKPVAGNVTRTWLLFKGNSRMRDVIGDHSARIKTALNLAEIPVDTD